MLSATSEAHATRYHNSTPDPVVTEPKWQRDRYCRTQDQDGPARPLNSAGNETAGNWNTDNHAKMTYPVAWSSRHQPKQRPTDHKITAQRFIAVRFSDYAVLSLQMDLADCITRVCMRVHIDQLSALSFFSFNERSGPKSVQFYDCNRFILILFSLTVWYFA